MSFKERAENMGLTKIAEDDFMFVDRFCKVFYRRAKTSQGSIPFYAISCTKDSDSNQEHIGGLVSEFYKFVGNEIIVERAKSSIY